MADFNVNPTGSEELPLSLLRTEEILGKQDFLQLLVMQLRHQDPLDPMDNTQFVAQLAEFSALEQMQNVNTGVENLTMLMQSVNNSLATELIGKDVKYFGNSVHLEGEPTSINYFLQAQAQVKIKIYDSSDNAVATLIVGEQVGGDKSIEWDGTGIDGNLLPDGDYHFKIEAEDQNGAPVSSVTYAVDKVRGLKFIDGNAVLIVGDDEIYLSEIIEILDLNQ